MGVALAAGIVTDTVRLRQANGSALRHLSIALDAAGMYVEDIWAVLENSAVRAARRPAILNSLHTIREVKHHGWSILVAEINSQDNAFVIMDTIIQLGWDIGLIGFPKGRGTMVISICNAELVFETEIDLGGWMKALVPEIGASEAWGTRAAGRIIAPLALDELLDQCEKTIRTML
jgi:hypothetical protein